ncbi:acetyl-CoA synthetase-like protein, partial [Coemansia reversa NRRL 1564]
VRPRDMPSEAYSAKLKDVMAAHENLPSVLRHRASVTPSEVAYTCVDGKGREVGSWTWAGLHTRAIQIAQLLRQKGVAVWGERVALVYRKYEVLDFVGSLFGCFYVGLCAVPIVAGDSYAELVHVLNSTGAVLVLTTELNIKALNKDLTQSDVGAGWPTGVDWLRTDNLGGNLTYNSQLEIAIDSIKPEDLAYIEFSKSPNGELKGVQITHGAVMRQCSTWMIGFNTGTPSANVAVFKDVVAFYIEPRQHLGLVYGILGGSYGGHQSVYVSSALCDIPGAYINLLTRYRATVALGDYTGLQSVLAAATDEPDEIFNYNKKMAPNLARLRLCLVDTLFIDSDFNAAFDKNVLHPFGCPYQGIAATEGHPVMTPVCTLAEHGSALMAMRDCLPSFAPPGAEESMQKYEFVLDRDAFKENRIVVLPDERNEAEVDRVGTVRYQSFGFPALDSTIAVVDPETRELCAVDAIGELWISSPALGSGFWGLPKLSSSIFGAQFTYVGAGGSEASGDTYLRTGLMGAVVEGQVLVFGFYEDRIRTLTAEPGASAVPGWMQEPALGFHYSGDINSTIRRYLPQVTECATFEMYSNDTHFPVVAAEVRQNSGMYSTIAEEVYGVLRNCHGLFAYAIALCPPESLPRAFQYGKRTVNAQLCRHLFESGKVNCLYVKISTDQLFLNLPPPAATLTDDVCDQDASVAHYGRWQQQTSLEAGMASVDEATGMDLASFQSITEVLAWRAGQTPDHVAYAQFDERGRALKALTFQKLANKVAGVAQLMLDRRRVGPGSHVIVAIAPSPSFVVAVHACLAIGAVPIAVAPPDIERLADDMPPLLVTAREYGAGIVLVDAQSEEVFKSKMMDVAMRVPALRALLGARRMPAILSLARASKSKHALGRGNLRFDAQWAAPGRPALVMLFTGAQPSTPQYVSYSHRALLRFCAQQKGDFQMPASLPLVASVRAYNGYGLLHCAVLGVYVGCTTLLLAPAHFFAAPNVWFELVQRHRVKDAFATLPMLQHAMNFFSAYIGQHSFNLATVRNLIIATDERVDPHTYAAIRDFFARHRLDEMAINPLYGTPMNSCISTRAYLGVGPLPLHLDVHALRRCRAVAVPPPEIANADALLHTLLLQDSGKVSGSTMVAIVDPATRCPLPAGSIGEVWVCSASNASRKHAPQPSMPAAVRPPPAVNEVPALLDGNSSDEFVRTGDLGFLYLQVAPGGAPTAPAEPYLFVVGKVVESFSVDGYMYFYSDIERAVAELADEVGMATFISLRGPPSDLFLPNAACLIFNNVLDRHQVLLDEIIFVPRDALPRSRIPERRRRTVRGMYESAKLKAYVNFPI